MLLTVGANLRVSHTVAHLLLLFFPSRLSSRYALYCLYSYSDLDQELRKMLPVKAGSIYGQTWLLPAALGSWLPLVQPEIASPILNQPGFSVAEKSLAMLLSAMPHINYA